MADFNYKATAELFLPRIRSPRRQPFGDERFAQAADAIRLAVDDLPRECLIGACPEVGGRRYGGDDIPRSYESAEYLLTRRAARS